MSKYQFLNILAYPGYVIFTTLVQVNDAPDQEPQFFIGNTILSVSEGSNDELLQIFACTGECDFVLEAADPDSELSWEIQFGVSDAVDNLGQDRVANLQVEQGRAGNSLPG